MTGNRTTVRGLSDLSPSTELKGLEPARECDCPPWVRRCAHSEETRLWLIDSDSTIEAMVARGAPADFKECPGCGRRRVKVPYAWGIVCGVMEEPQCMCKANLTPYTELHLKISGSSWSEDYDAALAAFHAAEERLLRSEA